MVPQNCPHVVWARVSTSRESGKVDMQEAVGRALVCPVLVTVRF